MPGGWACPTRHSLHPLIWRPVDHCSILPWLGVRNRLTGTLIIPNNGAGRAKVPAGAHPTFVVTRSEHAHVRAVGRAVGAPKYHKFGMHPSGGKTLTPVPRSGTIPPLVRYTTRSQDRLHGGNATPLGPQYDCSQHPKAAGPTSKAQVRHCAAPFVLAYGMLDVAFSPVNHSNLHLSVARVASASSKRT
jgi:hypothetical protein